MTTKKMDCGGANRAIQSQYSRSSLAQFLITAACTCRPNRLPCPFCKVWDYFNGKVEKNAAMPGEGVKS